MSAQLDRRALYGARVRFATDRQVVEGKVIAIGEHLVRVRDDTGETWQVDRYSLYVVSNQEDPS